MDIVIGLFSLVIGAFASYYILNKKLLSLSEKNIQLKTKIKDLKLQRLNAANAGQVERSQELGAQLNEMYSALTH